MSKPVVLRPMPPAPPPLKYGPLVIPKPVKPAVPEPTPPPPVPAEPQVKVCTIVPMVFVWKDGPNGKPQPPGEYLVPESAAEAYEREGLAVPAE